MEIGSKWNSEVEIKVKVNKITKIIVFISTSEWIKLIHREKKDGEDMKKIFLVTIILSSFIFAQEEVNKEVKEENLSVSTEKEDKIQSYISQKDSAWHKTEYNKVLKYLMKNKK